MTVLSKTNHSNEIANLGKTNLNLQTYDSFWNYMLILNQRETSGKY